jgi:hypothetical protein
MAYSQTRLQDMTEDGEHHRTQPAFRLFAATSLPVSNAVYLNIPGIAGVRSRQEQIPIEAVVYFSLLELTPATTSGELVLLRIEQF